MMDANLKTHYTAAELAALRLTGLPASERGVRKAAERENWPSRPRARGKGREYIPPATVLAELRDRSLQTCASRLALPLPRDRRDPARIRPGRGAGPPWRRNRPQGAYRARAHGQDSAARGLARLAQPRHRGHRKDSRRYRPRF